MSTREILAGMLADALHYRDEDKIVEIAKAAYKAGLELEDICDESSPEFEIVCNAIGASGWTLGF